MFSLAAKLLLNDKVFCKKMLGLNPFEDDDLKPAYVKADLFLYKFTSLSDIKNNKDWWTRKYVREYFPSANFKQLEAYVDDLGWTYEK